MLLSCFDVLLLPSTTLFFLSKSRFLINIPEEERKDVVRLCFQIETAHWFYVDFYRQEQPDLPTCGLKDFTRINILLLTVVVTINVIFELDICISSKELSIFSFLGGYGSSLPFSISKQDLDSAPLLNIQQICPTGLA